MPNLLSPLYTLAPVPDLPDGIAYVVIGQARPDEFYKQTCGAIELPGS